MTDFIDTFFDEKNLPDEQEINTFMELQKKLINLILWFSQKEPDLRPLTPETTQAKPKLELIKRELRLFEANKYKPTIVGTETNKKINEAILKRDEDLKSGNYKGTKKPHPRIPHWNFYWLGKRGTKEKWVNHWIPFQIVGGVPKEKAT